MKLTYQYFNEEERKSILEKNSGNYLIADKKIIEGNFLVFSTTKSLNEEVEELKLQNAELMLAVAEIGTTSAQSAAETQLAIAELATIVTGGVE